MAAMVPATTGPTRPRLQRRSASLSAMSTEKQVDLVAPRGYCAGVDRAIETVEKALDELGAPIYVRGEIVHNQHVVRTLAERGAVFVDRVDEVPEGKTIVLSAHGSAPEVYSDCEHRNLQVIDATCPLVSKVHAEVRRFARDGATVFLVGHAGHDEVIGTMGEAPDRVVLVEDLDDARTVEVEDPGERRPHHPDDAVDRRHRGDRQHAARTLSGSARTRVKRHLLRHPEPAGRGQAERQCRSGSGSGGRLA